jgi:hypothetical protein
MLLQGSSSALFNPSNGVTVLTIEVASLRLIARPLLRIRCGCGIHFLDFSFQQLSLLIFLSP